MTQTHLWEIDHPYYCTEGNYYKAGQHTLYESWADFAKPSGGSFMSEGNLLYDFDDDLNMLWRWDWNRPDPSDYEYEREEDPKFEIPGDTLLLFFMLQRKARCVSVEVAVAEVNEPEIRAWLTSKALHMSRVWEPFLTTTPTPEHDDQGDV